MLVIKEFDTIDQTIRSTYNIHTLDDLLMLMPLFYYSHVNILLYTYHFNIFLMAVKLCEIHNEAYSGSYFVPYYIEPNTNKFIDLLDLFYNQPIDLIYKFNDKYLHIPTDAITLFLDDNVTIDAINSNIVHT